MSPRQMARMQSYPFANARGNRWNAKGAEDIEVTAIR